MLQELFPMRRLLKATTLVAGLAGLIGLRFMSSHTEADQRPQQTQPLIGGLDLRFGDHGLQGLSWNAMALKSREEKPGSDFHVGHMKLSRLDGRVISGGDYDWGENAKSKEWNAAQQTWLYRFDWGSLAVRFVAGRDVLDVVTTATNKAGSNVVFDGATIVPLRLHFPMQPREFARPNDLQLAFGTDGPNVTVADFGSGEIAAVVANASSPLYTGFVPTQDAEVYDLTVSSTTPDGLASFQPHFDRPLLPGHTDSYTLSLRFAPSGTPVADLAGDSLHAWAEAHPMQLHWQDRRPMGTVFLASSPAPGVMPNAPNPRRYFYGQGNDFDVRTPEGLRAFQKEVLRKAQEAVLNMRRLGAQGVVTWDIEGEQYPQSISYVCAPDSLAQTAPEMESAVSISASPYKGLHLADAYFKTLSSAGFRVGVCVRPQHLTLSPDGLASQQVLDDAGAESELRRKIAYAHDRWGATLFYVDSAVRTDGTPLNAAIFKRLQKAFPDSLIMPEESTFAAFAYTAPFQSFLFHNDLGTASSVRAAYPRAFSVNLINDAGTTRVEKAEPALVQAVRGGDILMGHADFWSPENTQIQNLYQAAGLLH